LFGYVTQLIANKKQISNYNHRAANNFPAGAGQIARPAKDLTGQNLFLTGHCPLTGRYLQPWTI